MGFIWWFSVEIFRSYQMKLIKEMTRVNTVGEFPYTSVSELV